MESSTGLVIAHIWLAAFVLSYGKRWVLACGFVFSIFFELVMR